MSTDERVVRDEVDRLVSAWQDQRPELDVTPMQVLSRVTRLARHLDRERRSAFAAHGLENWEFDVLAALRRSGTEAPLTPGQLIKETMVTSGTMTNRLDRLGGRGLVTREDHPEDKRVVLVRLTDGGRTVVDAAMADLMEAERRILTDLPTEQSEPLADALRRLLARFDAPPG
jgi:DNA-binding MarR family transcriptional regulator